MTTQDSGGEVISENARNPLVEAMSKVLWGLYYVVLAGALTLVSYAFLGTAFAGSYAHQLVTERGYFQHANIFFLWLGVVLLVGTARRCLREAKAEKLAEKVMESVISRWQGDTGSALISEPSAQRNQGKEILSAMINSGVVREGSSSPRLTSDSQRMVFQRMFRIAAYLRSTRAQNLVEVGDMNRDLSALDADRLAGRFALVRYIVYLMPVIGFIGTVWGIGAALGGISKALPAIKELEGFTSQMGGATESLQIAFDTTFLALILSGILTLLLTLVRSQSENLLAAVDTWIIDNILRHITEHNPIERTLNAGFAQMIGRTDDGLYQDGLAGITAALAELRQDAGKVHAAVKSNANSASTIKAGLKEIGAHAAQAVEQINGLSNICEGIHKMQNRGQQQLQTLGKAVGSLPDTADTLKQTADNLKDAVGSLGELAEHLEVIGTLAEHVAAGADSLSDISGSLRMTLPGDDGQEKLIVAVEAIQFMRQALAEQMDKTSRDNAQKIGLGLKNVAEANQLLGGGISGIESKLNTLNQRFAELAAEIRSLVGKME